ncbi:hypothetical protein FOCC_FOCC014841 [Frankliniella occidentalis]|nr:hypothetical protein FOCC_FOCC014841 [Frankliniella occidentalis]
MQPTSATSVEDMHFKIKDEFVEEVIDIESEATIWGTQEALTSETRNQDMVFLEEMINSISHFVFFHFHVIKDGCTSTGKEEVLVVGATNWPGKIDEAARRRFTRRLYVPLPDEETRLEQFKHELSQEKHSISEDEFGLIAEKTKGYSGADITQVCRNAAMKPIRSLDPNGPSIEFITMDEVRPMNLSDFLESVNETTKSVSQEMIDQLEDFNNKFGSL